MGKLTASEINLSTLGKLTEGDARKLLEKLRWAHGPVCPHCGVIGDAKRMESAEETEHRIRDGVLNCRACRKPFTVTVGTIFEGSHIPLSKWRLGQLPDRLAHGPPDPPRHAERPEPWQALRHRRGR